MLDEQLQSIINKNDRQSLQVFSNLIENTWNRTITAYAKLGRVGDPGTGWHTGIDVDRSEEYHCTLKYIPGIYD